MADTVNQTLSKWVSGLMFEDIPKPILEHNKLQFLDTLGVILAANSMGVGGIVRRAALEMGSGDAAMWLVARNAVTADLASPPDVTSAAPK